MSGPCRGTVCGVLDAVDVLEGSVYPLRHGVLYLLEALRCPESGGGAWARLLDSVRGDELDPVAELLATAFREYDARVQSGIEAVRGEVEALGRATPSPRPSIQEGGDHAD